VSYPTQLKLFKAWSKAMEQGATVGKPDYGKTLTGRRKKQLRKKRHKRKRFLRRKRKKEE